MKSLNNRKKKIRIFLPKNYFETDESYPVLYMHDGQTLVDKAIYNGYSWEVMRTMDMLSSDYGNIIIVGLDSNEEKRIQEYLPILTKKVISFLNRTKNISKNEIKPELEQYGEFIVNQVKPYIDNNFRVKKQMEFTYIAGASCGGIASLYLGVKYQNIFSTIGAFSPAYWYVREEFKDFLNNSKISENIRIYHDMGKKENGKYSDLYLDLINDFDHIIKKKLPQKNIKLIIDRDGEHNELFWGNRFCDFYKFLLEK